MGWRPDVCLERYGSHVSRDGFRVGTLHTMWYPHPCGAHNCLLLTSLPDAEQRKEGEKNPGSFKYTLVAIKMGDFRVTWNRALYMP